MPVECRHRLWASCNVIWLIQIISQLSSRSAQKVQICKKRKFSVARETDCAVLRSKRQTWKTLTLYDFRNLQSLANCPAKMNIEPAWLTRVDGISSYGRCSLLECGLKLCTTVINFRASDEQCPQFCMWVEWHGRCLQVLHVQVDHRGLMVWLVASFLCCRCTFIKSRWAS